MSILPTIRGVPINHRFFPVYSLSSSRKTRFRSQPLLSTLDSHLILGVRTNFKLTKTYVIETFCPLCDRSVNEQEIILLQDDQEGCITCCPDHKICDRCGYWTPEDLKISKEAGICNRCTNSYPDAKNNSEMDIPHLGKIESIKVLESYINRILAVENPKSQAQ